MGVAIAWVAGLVGAAGGVWAAEKSGELGGKVYRSDTGEAISGARVLLMDRSADQEHSVETTTSSSGEYKLVEVHPGKYTVSIRASFDRPEDAPCKLLMGRTELKGSVAMAVSEGGRPQVQVFVENFKVKAGKSTRQDFDLVCRSVMEE